MRLIEGYRGFAGFIVKDKDRSPAIYRRFDYLAARRLLWLQSELLELEAQLRAFDIEDDKAPLGQKAIASDWTRAVARAKDDGDEYAKERVELAKKIGEKLTEYRDCAILEHKFRAIEHPAIRQLEGTKYAFNNKERTGIPALRGNNEGFLDDEHDLMSLRVPTDDDRLTMFLKEYLPIFFLKPQRTTDIEKLLYFSERRLHAFVVIVYIILAVLLLFGAIFNLYYVQDMQKRLGIIAGYTSVFALCVGFLTNARRAEVFGACAAYAAVLVVFVSGGLSSDCQQSTGQRTS